MSCVDEHPSRKGRFLTLLVLLIALDAITKIAAFTLLDHDAALALRAPIQLVLRINDSGLGSHFTGSFADSDRSVVLLVVTLFDATLAGGLLIMACRSAITPTMTSMWFVVAAMRVRWRRRRHAAGF